MPQRRPARLLVLAAAFTVVVGCDRDEQAQPQPTEAATAATEAGTEQEGGGAERDGDRGRDRERVRTYTVKRGDTLTSIARDMNSTVDAIIRANDLEDPDAIFPGDELKVPVAR